MRPNRLRKTLESGKLAIGLVHFSGSASVISVMGAAGLDWVTIDTEHASNDVGQLKELIHAADAAEITPIIRLPHVNRWIIQQLLDEGAGGIMISHVSSKAQAIEAVNAVKFPPLGERGACGNVRAAGYDPPKWSDFAAASNRETMVFLLIEDKDGFDAVDEILAVEGVDVIFVGRVDFSLSIGLPGESRWDHPVLRPYLERVVASAKKHNVYVQVSMGEPHEDPEYAASVIHSGVSLVSCGSDVLSIVRSFRRLTTLRELPRTPSG